MRRAAVWLALAGLVPARLPAQSRQAMLVAEDARDASPGGLKPLLDGLAAREPTLVVQAIRGLGRFERASLAPRVTPFLKDPRVEVRIAAAHALGQLGQDTAGVTAIGAGLLAAAATETDPAAAGALARSLGRLPWRTGDEASRARAAVAALAGQPGPASLLVDATRALESLVRLSGRLLGSDPALATRLRTLAQLTGGGPAAAPETAAVRRAALLTLIHLGQADRATTDAALADPEVEVRRLAVVALGDTAARPERAERLTRALGDPDPMVRFEAVRAWGRTLQAEDCRPVLRAVADPVIAVSLEAIDQLARRCGSPEPAVRALRPLVDSLVAPERWRVRTIANWHRGAHALVALAALAPDQVRGTLTRAASQSTWEVRMYAARAAAVVGDVDRLLVLAEDPNDNVRDAAVAGLHRLRPTGATRVYLAELERDDHQLLITTAKALGGIPDRPGAVAALLRALRRTTAHRRDNSRDARLALIDRLAELGGPALADSLTEYLQDYDPAVAARAAGALTRWTGRSWTPDPRPLPLPPVDAAESDALRGAMLRFTMSSSSGGGVFDIALDPEMAPVTVARVARLAGQGYYDGLTFHRVEPNFVIQGGGPKANEYTGDGPFLRDEVGPLSHERGTVGISTRGRDTGDAQLFVNLAENLRLDFNYTVFGRVVVGLDLVESLLEGDVIERVDVIRR